MKQTKAMLIKSLDEAMARTLIDHLIKLGRQGGLSTSKAKQEAARANGKRGGRPRGKK